MTFLTLHDMVQKTLENGHQYCATDKDGDVDSYSNIPTNMNHPQSPYGVSWWLPHDTVTATVTGEHDSIKRLNWISHIGRSNLSCHWRDSLMNATIITLRGTT